MLSGDLETNPGPAKDQMDFSNNISAFNCLPKKGLTIIYLNVRSVRNKVDEVKNILSTYSKEIEIMGLTESWLNEEYTNNLLYIPGYSLIRNDHNATNSHKTKGGDVIAFINDSLAYGRRVDLECVDIELIALDCNIVFCLSSSERSHEH